MKSIHDHLLSLKTAQDDLDLAKQDVKVAASEFTVIRNQISDAIPSWDERITECNSVAIFHQNSNTVSIFDISDPDNVRFIRNCPLITENVTSDE